MEQELAFIQNQLWVLIALLSFFVAGVIYCNLSQKKETIYKDVTNFGELWDKGEIDELLINTKKHLENYPNHSSALYFRAKALITVEKYEEAKPLLDTLSLNHPELNIEIDELYKAANNENS